MLTTILSSLVVLAIGATGVVLFGAVSLGEIRDMLDARRSHHMHKAV